MARYIDADALIQLIAMGEGTNTQKFKMKCYVELSPTADVVSRSEVARELNAFAGKVGRIYNHYVFEDTDYAEDDVAIEAVINALTEVLNDLSDLCQKYTEGKI